MRLNQVKQKLRARDVSLGLWIEDVLSPERVELFGHLGFDFVILDAEHASFNPHLCLNFVRACEIADLTPIVRVPDHTPSTILSYLETGVLGIYAPHVRTAADARNIVEAVKYAPDGHRGSGGSTRAANYGVTQRPSQYFAEANEQTMVCVLVEDEAGLENLEEILQVHGIDCVDLGPGDLSHSLGVPGQTNHPRVREALQRAEATILASKVPWICEPYSAGDALRDIERGALLVPFVERKLTVEFLQRLLAEVRQAAALEGSER
jgi:2-keto-3-deoxy-L-rhamnonate aldolase RhmA